MSWYDYLLLLILLFCNNGFLYQMVAERPANAVARFELIHRHAPQLGKHNSNNNNVNGRGAPKNRLERIKQLIELDNARQQVISQKIGISRRKSYEVRSSNLIEMPLRSASDVGTGQYFVSFRVGTPPQKFVLIADTGSDLTWVNCNSRCPDCVPSGSGRKFHPDQSRSFKTVPCRSEMCMVDLAGSFSLDVCPSDLSPCIYDYRYSDGSRATGFFGNDTVTVGLNITHRKMKLHDIVIGCSDWSMGRTFFDADGVMGLGYNKHSFAVKAAKMFGHKFSYCLVDHLSPSNLVNYLNFGNTTDATLIPKMQYTELVLGVINPFYAVKISHISIAGKTIDIPPQVWDVYTVGGVVLDSGSTLTHLSEPAYIPIMTALKSHLSQFNRVDLNLGPMEYCFNSSGFDVSKAPKFEWHFANGIRFAPPVKSYIIDAAEGIKCIGLAYNRWPSTSVIGNIMQQNYYWEFDLLNEKLGFAPSTCTVSNY